MQKLLLNPLNFELYHMMNYGSVQILPPEGWRQYCSGPLLSNTTQMFMGRDVVFSIDQ